MHCMQHIDYRISDFFARRCRNMRDALFFFLFFLFKSVRRPEKIASRAASQITYQAKHWYHIVHLTTRVNGATSMSYTSTCLTRFSESYFLLELPSRRHNFFDTLLDQNCVRSAVRKLWPVGQIWPTAHFRVARMAV